MRMRLALLAVVFAAPAAGAKVWTTVYRCDGVTPLAAVDPNSPTIYRDVMVGTRLVLVVRSDGPGIYGDHLLWSGRLSISWDDAPRGRLSGRGYNAKWRSYEGSCLPAAGPSPRARVQYRENASGTTFDLIVGSSSVAGAWFVLDYRAERTGICHVLRYDSVVGFTMPTEVLSFAHVPSRDFNHDTVVDAKDFALLAARWGSAVNPDGNGPEAAFDLDGDGTVGAGDVAHFSEHWLQRTDCTSTETPTATSGI